MLKRVPFIIALIICSMFVRALPAAAGDEYREAARQTEDQWQAVRGTLKESKKALDDLQKNYKEYHDAVFSDSPEKGLELARILFKLDKSETRAAEAKVQTMRNMFTEMDNAGITKKLGAASQYLGTANNYASEVENLWEFTRKFDPDHAKDNPTYGLRLIGTLLSESASKMEAIPLVGQVLGKWVKAYGEVADDFANALDRLTKKIDDFRGGSLCGQLGKRQGQQEAFKAAGGSGCQTYFACDIFPRMRGETYEGDMDYFLYDPATGRGYIASKQADIVYRWHQLLLEPRALDPAWLAGRANSLKPEVISQAREAYVLFNGWESKSESGWVIIDKLGLYQDAYVYGLLDEQTFMGNYILTKNHHAAVDAILREYEKYVLINGTISEDDGNRFLPSSGVLVEFTVEGELYSSTTGADGRYEILIRCKVNDRIHEKITKVGFETITGDGIIPRKVVNGLDYTLEKDRSTGVLDPPWGDENLDFRIGELMILPGVESTYTGARYAVGDPIGMHVDVTEATVGPATPITATWLVTRPDGRVDNLRPTRLLAAEGVSGSLTNDIRTDENMPLGTYLVEIVISFRDSEITRRQGSFELVPLFEDSEILITDSEESTVSLEAFRPADPLLVLAKFNYNSVDPSRQIHLTVDFEGPDQCIGALGHQVDQTYLPGAVVTGAGRQVPDVIREGVYTATITLAGGNGQNLALQRTFAIVYPVRFDGTWTRDWSVPPQVQARFAGNDPFEWFMRYEFGDVRPDDQYSSALWCNVDDVLVNVMSSELLGPDTPFPGPATSSFTGVVPLDMPSGTYEVNGAIWVNGVAYNAPGTTIKLGQEPTITITSPQSGFEVDRKVLVVKGTCADPELTQAILLTNGESIPIKLHNGEFSAKTVLRPGGNEIVVVAENDLGTSEASVWGNANIRAAALKIVLSWEAAGTDIDLWVTDPQGVVTNYQNKKAAEGRELDVDDQSGPGMETYTVEIPLRGRYEVAVHYYGAGSWQGTVPFNLQITTWETTFSETHGTTGGTLYKAAGNKDEPGAVEYFTVLLD